MAEVDIVKIPNDPNVLPTVEVKFTHANVGGYRLYLWDPANTAAEFVGEGDNTDNKPDKFSLKKPASGLNGYTIYLEAGISSANPGGTFSSNNESQYSVIVEIGPNTIGSKTYPGQLKDGRAAEVRFIGLQH